jgi:hypothetical protein
VLGNPLFTHYLVVPAQSPVSLAVLPVVVGPAGDDPGDRPRLVLTVVPTAD